MNAAAKFLSLSIICFYSFQPVRATSYYIDSRNGNDRNSGTTPGNPWKSLEKVNDLMLQPGDSVLFHRSSRYTGQLKISARGRLNDLIVFSAYGKGDNPRVDGNGLFPETVLIVNSEYLRVEGIEITNLGPEREAGRRGLHILLENFGIAHAIQIQDVFVHDVNGSNVKKEGGGAGIHWTNKGDSIRSAFDGLIIENCRIERTDRNGITSSSAYIWRDNWFPSRHVIIRNNHLNDIGGDAIVPIGCDSALIEYNTVYYAGQRFPEDDAAAGIWPWSCDNTLIQYNEVAYTGGPWDSQGFDSDWNCLNTTIQYNYSHDNTGGFLLICDNGSVTRPKSAGNRGTIIRYNVSINDGLRSTFKHAGFSPVFHITGPVVNTQIYNNVIYIPARPSTLDSTIIEMDTWHGYPDSTLVANNIFWVEGTANYNMAKSTRNFYYTNLYHGNHLRKPLTTGEVFALDPGFKSLPSKNIKGFKRLNCFMLKPASKCKGAGTILISDTIHDFFGNKVYPNTSPAIGIHELK